LVPVATENGITSLGEYVFQLNSDRERKARALAEYASKYLNCRTFVTIAPQDEYGQQMTDGLSAAVDSLGGEIFAQKWYYDQPQDLGRHFKAIREAAFRRNMEDTLKLAGVTVNQSNREAYWRDLNYRFMKEGDFDEGLVGTLSKAVTNIDAVFLPLYPEDIRLIANQFAYYNIRAILLGGDYWQQLDVEARRELQRIIDGAIFVSDYYVDATSISYIQFRNSYRQAMGVTPTQYDILGYDAASLFLYCLNQGARSPAQLRQTLAQVDGFAGMKGEISLNNPNRVNSRVNILQISGTEFKKLK